MCTMTHTCLLSAAIIIHLIVMSNYVRRVLVQTPIDILSKTDRQAPSKKITQNEWRSLINDGRLCVPISVWSCAPVPNTSAWPETPENHFHRHLRCLKRPYSVNVSRKTREFCAGSAERLCRKLTIYKNILAQATKKLLLPNKNKQVLLKTEKSAYRIPR